MSRTAATPRSTTTAAPAAAAPARTVERRTSLSRGPALILGTILLAAGLYFLYRAHFFPRFGNFPNGRAPVDHKAFFGIFGVNGWSGMLTAVAGGLLLFGAAEHYMSKAMSLFVGGCLLAAAIIAAVSGDVLGLAAANLWTKLGWGISGAILLLNALMPARRRVIEQPAAAYETARPRTFARTRRITGGPGRSLEGDAVPAEQPGTMAPAGRTAGVPPEQL
jgi:hypothetical protein